MIAIPTVVIVISLFIIVAFNFASNIKLVENYTVSALNRISLASESKTDTIVNMTSVLSGNTILSEALEKTDFVYTENLSKELNKLKNAYDFLDNVYIFNQKREMVVTGNGIFSLSDFFNSEYKYQNYDLPYWKGFKFYSTDKYRILSPTIVSRKEKYGNVMPIVFRRIDGISMKNLLIFNINLQKLIALNNFESLTPNSSVYVLNKYTKEIFTSEGKILPINSFPYKVYQNLLIGTPNPFTYKLNHSRVTITSYSPNNTLVGYTYFAIIPTGDILKQLLPNIWLSLTIIILFLVVSSTIVLRNTSQIFDSLKGILRMFSGKEYTGQSGNIFEDIKAFATATQKLNQKLTDALPCAQEKYLINFLNSTEYYIDEDARNVILASLNFPNELFAVVIIQLEPTSKMFDIYNYADYANIQNGFYSIVNDLFSKDFITFVLPGENNVLYIILNMENSEDTKHIEKTMENIYECIKNDMLYVNLSIGKSGVYKDLDGLKQAHREALNAFTVYESSHNKIILDSSSDLNYIFNSKNENDLFTSLLAIDKDKAYTTINEILKKNSELPPRTQKRLYNYILNIVLKVMRMKKMSYMNDKLDFEILSDCLNQPPEGIQRDMMVLIDYILMSGNKTEDNKVDCSAIIKYIQENYCFTELSLDFLSNYFQINQSIISTMIKNELEIGFHDYLTTLRIEKAKQLLVTTDKNIQEICSECGFSSQQTFFRVFKNLVGMTSGEYRKQLKK